MNTFKKLLVAAGLATAAIAPLAAQADGFSISIGDGPGYYRPYYAPRYYAPPQPVYYYGGPRYYDYGYQDREAWERHREHEWRERHWDHEEHDHGGWDRHREHDD